MMFALFFRFFDSWYIIKYLLTETSGKQYVLWILDCRYFPRLCLRNIDSLGVNYTTEFAQTKQMLQTVAGMTTQRSF